MKIGAYEDEGCSVAGLGKSKACEPLEKFNFQPMARYAAKQILIMLAHIRRICWNDVKWQEATGRAEAKDVEKVNHLCELLMSNPPD